MKRFLKPPKKSETLASKVEERNFRKKRLLAAVRYLPAEKWVGIGEIVSLLVILLINFWLLMSFFGQKDEVNAFSAPLIPILARSISFLISYSHAVRLWLLIFLLAFPFSFYFFIREISKRKLAALVAVLIANLPIGIFLPLRVTFGLFSEDGGHIASLTLVPLVCLSLLKFLRQGNFWTAIFSALGTTIVALTSPLGLMVLAIFMGVITFSEMLLGLGRLKFLRFLIVFVFSVGFSAFWYNPQFVLLTINSSQGQLMRQILTNLLPLSFFLLPLLGVFGFLLFENRPELQPLFLALFLTISFGLLSLGAGISLPTPSRFLASLGISSAFLAGILFIWFLDFLRQSPELQRFEKLVAYRHLLAFLLTGFFLCLLLVITDISGRNFTAIEQSQVLGWSDTKKVGIWELREKSSSAGNFFGGGISISTIGLVVFLGRRLKENELKNNK